MPLPKDPGDVDYPSYIDPVTGLPLRGPAFDGFLWVNRPTVESFFDDFETGGYCPGGAATNIDGVNGWAYSLNCPNNFNIMATPGSLIGGAVCIVPTPTGNVQSTCYGKPLPTPIPTGTDCRISFWIDFIAEGGVPADGDQNVGVWLSPVNDWLDPADNNYVLFLGTGRIQVQDSMGAVLATTAAGYIANGRHFIEIVRNHVPVTSQDVYMDGVLAFNLANNDATIKNFILINPNCAANFANLFQCNIDGIRVDMNTPVPVSYPLSGVGAVTLRNGEVTDPIAVSGITRISVTIQGGAIDPSDPPPYANNGYNAAATLIIEATANGVLWGAIAAVPGNVNNTEVLLNFPIGIPGIRFRAALPNDADQAGITFTVAAFK